MLSAALALFGASALSLAGHPEEGPEVVIKISPNTLVLSAPTTWVTVHTNLPIGSVVGSSVELNGIPAGVIKADSRGCLVAKFRIGDIAPIVAPPSATLTLTGVRVDGTEFAASDTIAVRK